MKIGPSKDPAIRAAVWKLIELGYDNVVIAVSKNKKTGSTLTYDFASGTGRDEPAAISVISLMQHIKFDIESDTDDEPESCSP